MMNIDQIKEIKKGVTHSKLALWQALHDLMSIDEIDLMEVREMTAEQIKEVRKKVTRLRGFIGQKLNGLFELLYSSSMEPSRKDGDER
jgi:D-hexose-6-phosphate mutarotase